MSGRLKALRPSQRSVIDSLFESVSISVFSVISSLPSTLHCFWFLAISLQAAPRDASLGDAEYSVDAVFAWLAEFNIPIPAFITCGQSLVLPSEIALLILLRIYF